MIQGGFLYLERQPWSRHIGVYLGGKSRDNITFPNMETIQWITKPHMEMATHQEPIISIEEVHLQGLMDQLWAMGLRPNRNNDTDAVHAAQNANLDDLRMVNVKLLSMVDFVVANKKVTG